LRRVVVSSFFPEILLRIRALDREVPLGFIADQRARLASWSSLPIQCVMPHHRLTTEEFIEAAHTRGVKACVWTVNESEAMRRFAEWGADAIISDNTELLVRTLGRSRSGTGSRAPEA
jgi:glycerophosphoryl diester phosphodiesterase